MSAAIFDGENESIYRLQTAEHKMPGVMRPSFICPRCQQSKGTAGRKIITKGYPRGGYVCGECVKGVA